MPFYAVPHIHYGGKDLSHPEHHLDHLLPVRHQLGVVRGGGGKDGDGVGGAYRAATVGSCWL